MADTTVRELDPKLRNLSVFAEEGTIAGMPGKIFVALSLLWLTITIVLFVYFNGWVAAFIGLVFLIVLFVPAYLVHKDDPQGYQTWLRAIWTPGKLSSVAYKKRRICVLVANGTKIKFVPLRDYF